LVINANLIMGNSADSGTGGGLRFQSVNGTDVPRFPSTPTNWYSVKVTNNIISNNVAGWDGAGVSLEDSLAVNLVNNTIVSNDSTATAGPLFNTLGAPQASSQSPPPPCAGTPTGTTGSCPQAAGVVALLNSPQLTSSYTPGSLTCPAGHFKNAGDCEKVSYPLLYNDFIWQNRSFYIGVGTLGTGTQNQQDVVSIFNANFAGGAGTTPTSQSITGGCPTGSSYWEIGVRGDTGPSNHGSGFTLAPTYSMLSDSADYPGLNNFSFSSPNFVSQYCNGARVPPENGGLGYQVPPGISDATVPNPIFAFTPAATVDEGNNWINMSWGPLALTNPSVKGADGNYGGGAALGNYSLATGSPAIDAVPSTEALPSGVTVPNTDFFGLPRPDPADPDGFDIGAVEYQLPASPHITVTPVSLNFGTVAVNRTSSSQTLTLRNDGNASFTFGTLIFSPTVFSRSGAGCGATLAPNTSCTINVVFTPSAAQSYSGTLSIGGNTAVPQVSLTGTGAAAIVSPTSLSFGSVGTGTTSSSQTLTLTTGLALTSINVAVTAPFSRSGGTCGTTLGATSSCTILIVFAPTAQQAYTGSVTITSSQTVTGSPVSLTGTGIAPPKATVSPSTLAFGNRATGVTSNSLTLTVTNTGTTTLTGGTFTFGGGTPQPFARAGILQAGGPGTCGTTLTAGASCTYNVVFTPTTSTSFTRTLTVAYAGGAVVTGSPVTLTGTGVTGATLSYTSATNGTLSTGLLGRALTFTIPSPRAPVTSVVTVTNTGASPLQITSETVTNIIGSTFSLTGTTCSFTTPLAVNGTCTVSIRYATPATPPIIPNTGTLSAPNNGTTPAGTLILSGQ
jgi:hypothetical protein